VSTLYTSTCKGKYKIVQYKGSVTVHGKQYCIGQIGIFPSKVPAGRCLEEGPHCVHTVH